MLTSDPFCHVFFFFFSFLLTVIITTIKIDTVVMIDRIDPVDPSRTYLIPLTNRTCDLIEGHPHTVPHRSAHRPRRFIRRLSRTYLSPAPILSLLAFTIADHLGETGSVLFITLKSTLRCLQLTGMEKQVDRTWLFSNLLSVHFPQDMLHDHDSRSLFVIKQ